MKSGKSKDSACKVKKTIWEKGCHKKTGYWYGYKKKSKRIVKMGKIIAFRYLENTSISWNEAFSLLEKNWKKWRDVIAERIYNIIDLNVSEKKRQMKSSPDVTISRELLKKAKE